MEQTQLLDWDEDPDDPPEGDGDARETPKPVGRLHLLSSKYGPEKDFWIYPGENAIGRLESCQICLPMISVSKAHAMIEVPSPDGPHLLYDQGSLNRTRRQRVVLIPQVRYNLQDGDALLFGDVGCQYFMLVPGGDTESPNDSMEVPPTQAIVEASTLAIEETPQPWRRRRMGFEGVLVQDSDKEEEEELVNGTGKILHLAKSDGSDSSIKDGTKGDSNSATSKFFSPSTIVVPESDEESEEPSSSSTPGPSLHLSFEKNVDESGGFENGVVTPLNQVRHPAQCATMETEPKATLDSGEPAAKEQIIPTDPPLVDFHLHSDTDAEEMSSASEMPGFENLAKDDLSLEVGSDTDSEEPVVANSDVGCKKDHQAVTDVGSDTDAEEAAESSSVSGLKSHQPAQNEDDDTDVEGTVEDLGATSHESSGKGPPDEGSDKGMEEMGGNPQVCRPDEKRDSTGAEEAANNPDMPLQAQQPPENEDSDTDVEEASLKVEKSQEAHEAAGDSTDDRDVEVTDAELEDLGGDGPHSFCPTNSRDSSVDGEEISTQGVVVQGDNNVVSGCGTQETKNLNPEAQRSQGIFSEQSSDFDVKKPLETPQVVENTTNLPPKQCLPMLSVDSDTDVEEASESPEAKESHKVAGDSPREKDAESPLEDPDSGPQRSSGSDEDVGPQKSSGPDEDDGSDTDMKVISPTHGTTVTQDSDTDVEEVISPLEDLDSGPQRSCGPGEDSGPQKSSGPGEDAGPQKSSGPDEDGGSDTDMKVISPTHGPTVTQDSDTDVEEVITPLPGRAIEEQETQFITVGSWVAGKKSANSAAEHEPCEEEEDTDGHKSHAGDENNTTDDSDLAFQATQCYLPAAASSPKPGETREITGLACSSPLKDEDSDPDAYMLEATQAFCKEPGLLSEEPTQAFAAEEEDTELFFHNPPEGGELTEQPTQPAFPILASRAQQADHLSEESTRPYSIGLPSSPESIPLPAGSTTAEESEEKEEIKPVGSEPDPSADGSHPLVLQEEVTRSPEQPCVAASDAESPAERSQAGHIERESTERSSTGEGAGNAKQCFTEGPSEPVSSAPVLRRSLRLSSATASPASIPEGQSNRSGHVEATNTNVSDKPLHRVTRRRGLRQLGNPTQYMKEPEKKMVQPDGEGVIPNKKPRNGELTGVGCRSRTRGLQGESSADSRPEEKVEAGVDSPGTRVSTRRGQRRTSTELVEKQPELPRTRVSNRRSGSSSATTPSPKDSGESTKPRQESAEPTSSSRRRSRRLSTESKPVETETQSRIRTRSSSASRTPAPKVLFTGVIDEEGEHVVAELGGSMAKSVFDCTLLVTDRVRRTVKFLCALARGIPIVTLDWLEKSRHNSSFLEPNKFLICDPEQEENFQFSLAESLQKVKQTGGLFQGYEIHVTPNVKPEPEHMRDIVKCSGGTFLSRMPRAYKDKRIVISCPEDLPRCKAAQDARLPIANSELILTGILQQKVDLETHCLDTPSLDSPAASATRTSKRRAAVPIAPVPPCTAKRRR